MFFDILSGLLILTLAVLGYKSGALRQVAALAAFAVALLAVARWGGKIVEILGSQGFSSLALVVSFVVGWLFLAGVFRLVIDRFASQRKTVASGILGAFVGAIQAVVLIIALSLSIIGSPLAAMGDVKTSLREARIYPLVASAGDRIVARAPNESRVSALTFPKPLDQADIAEAKGPLRPIVWAEVKPFSAQAERALSGTIRAAERAPLSFEESGRVVAVYVATGNRFSKGDMLARLDDTALRQTLEQAEASVIEAEATLAEAQADFSRQSQLFRRNVVAEAAVDRVVLKRDAAQARLEMARSAAERARDRLQDTELRAPYDGRVAERKIEPSQIVTAGVPVFDIQGNQGGFEVELDVPENMLLSLKPGARETVRVTGIGATVTGEVAEIGARGSGSSLFPVIVRLIDPPAGIRAGMSAEVRVTLDNAKTATGLIVPVTAILPGDGDESYVFTHDRQTSRLTKRQVNVLSFEGRSARIAEGDLAEGTIIAAKGVPFLEDGQAVELMGTGYARYDN
ncbi:CvpA family protein [Pseudahrensia aquimaris]|uniref:CvpA family protein n=1 Tax=Pseudahrensia aquimaris TaxID=744461 RepID=A0ABW3FI06_9HYPH